MKQIERSNLNLVLFPTKQCILCKKRVFIIHY